MVVFTVPELGNTGFNRADRESAALHPAGLVCRRLNAPSSWRSEEPLDAALRRAARPALAGVDTRA
ncbi:MAG: carbamoyl-phosphate synthase small subunit, partial [Kiritimatiellae bacterium]|nr:carbamoyl-phosphate synthase small subunit [Kiritimatiellia bacterium]